MFVDSPEIVARVPKPDSSRRGFTLIELIMVLLILGVLAAFALPRFANVNAEARVTAMQGLASALRSSSALVHGLAVARGQTDATGSVPLEGSTVSLVNGYPAASAAGIGITVVNLEGFAVKHVPPQSTFRPIALKEGTLCVVTYTETTGVVDQSKIDLTNCK